MAIQQSPIKTSSLGVSKAPPLRILTDSDCAAESCSGTVRQRHDEENALITKMLSTAQALVLILDREGLVVQANEACETLSGLAEVEMVGQPIWDILTPPTKTSLGQWGLADWAAMVADGSLESYWRTTSGETRQIRWETFCLTGAADAAGYVVATGVDITGREDGEAVLRQELNLMRAIMEDSPYPIYFKDRQGRFLRRSRANGRPLGGYWDNLDVEDVIGKTDFDFFTEDHARQAYEDEQEIIRTGIPFNNEERETPGC